MIQVRVVDIQVLSASDSVSSTRAALTYWYLGHLLNRHASLHLGLELCERLLLWRHWHLLKQGLSDSHILGIRINPYKFVNLVVSRSDAVGVDRVENVGDVLRLRVL